MDVILKDGSLGEQSFEDRDGARTFRHTTSHILAQAVKKLYPDAKLAIGPAIDDGFYYDFEFSSPISSDDFKAIGKGNEEDCEGTAANGTFYPSQGRGDCADEGEK